MARAPMQALALPFRKTGSDRYEFAVFKRADVPQWQGIAGGGEDGETPAQAARREIVEESGIPASAPLYRLDATTSIPVHFFPAARDWPADLYVITEHAFAVDASGFEIVLSEEHSEYVWTDFQTAVELLRWESNRTALWELHERIERGELPNAE